MKNAKTILIVDDAALIRQLVATALMKEGYSVVEAKNGLDAIDKIADVKIDMAITDINMPRMSGIDFIRQLRNIPDYKFIPVIMLTSESQELQKKEGILAGASAWISKPFTNNQLLDTIRRFLR